jgi:hypothetical protein
MLVQATATLVRPYTSQIDFEKRTADRHECALDARTSPLDDPDGFAWGASIRDLSRTGLGLTVCFPFRVGSYQVGCEFVRPLSETELERLI